MNGYTAAKEEADKLKPESGPDCPATSECSELTNQSQKSTRSDPQDDNSTSSDDT